MEGRMDGQSAARQPLPYHLQRFLHVPSFRLERLGEHFALPLPVCVVRFIPVPCRPSDYSVLHHPLWCGVRQNHEAQNTRSTANGESVPDEVL
jgi:hypothetical protein